MITRLMNEDDIPDVLKISNSHFKGNESWDYKSFISELSNHLAHCFVIEDNSNILGFANVWIVAGEANINSIAVNKIFQSKGIGSQILHSILEYCIKNSTNEITLEVRKSNIRAQKLYEKYGFNINGERKNYYSNNGETALLMSNRNIQYFLENTI